MSEPAAYIGQKTPPWLNATLEVEEQSVHIYPGRQVRCAWWLHMLAWMCATVFRCGIFGAIQICLEARDWPQGLVVWGLTGTSCYSMKDRAWDELDASYRPSGLALPKASDKPAMLFVSMADEGDSSDIISRRPLECRGLVPLLTWTICGNGW